MTIRECPLSKTSKELRIIRDTDAKLIIIEHLGSFLDFLFIYPNTWADF